MFRQNGYLTNLLEPVSKSASECLFEGSICYLDNAQIEAVAFEMVLPLQ